MAKTFPAVTESISEITQYTEQRLEEKRVTESLINEYRLLIEEIAIKLIEKAAPNAEISVSVVRSMGSISIELHCQGQVISLAAEDEFDFGGRILEEFGNNLSQTYSAGKNHVTFSSTNNSRALLFDIISVAASLLVVLLLRTYCSGDQIAWMKDNIAYPITVVFTRCMQILATPVAFFSLAAFLIELQMTLNRDRRVVRLVVRYFVTSIVAMLIGLALWLLTRDVISLETSSYVANSDNFMGSSVKDILLGLMGNNILEPFMLTNPIPMLMLGILAGVAVSRQFGEYGATARKAINTCCSTFCGMLNLAYSVIPFFMFFALLYQWLDGGYQRVFEIFKLVALGAVPIVVLLLFYALQMIGSGYSPISFVREYGDILLENLKIGSNVEAVPYNRRMLYRKEKIQRDYLNMALELGSVMNMDGNCVMVATCILFQLTMAGLHLEPVQEIGMAVIMLLISVGAPNQPGSFLICMAVLMSFVGLSTEAYSTLLIMEAFLGKLYSTANSVGDITTIVLEWKKLQKEPSQKPE